MLKIQNATLIFGRRFGKKFAFVKLMSHKIERHKNNVVEAVTVGVVDSGGVVVLDGGTNSVVVGMNSGTGVGDPVTPDMTTNKCSST